MVQERRRSIDSKVMVKRLSIQVFICESDPLTLRDFTLQTLRIEDITGQVQGGTALDVGADTQPMRPSTKLIDCIARGEPDLLGATWTDLTAQMGEWRIKLELQQSGARGRRP